MQPTSIRFEFFDASALVKVFSEEPGSATVREYFNTHPGKYTTPFCFYESLNVLKGKWKYKRQMSEDEYRKAAFALTAWYGASSQSVDDLNFSDPLIFQKIMEVAQKYHLDLSDAFQIVSVRDGFSSAFAAMFITADNLLCQAARNEGLLAWNILLEAPPP
jgi:predicted nucleic acid-binding protein